MRNYLKVVRTIKLCRLTDGISDFVRTTGVVLSGDFATSGQTMPKSLYYWTGECTRSAGHPHLQYHFFTLVVTGRPDAEITLTFCPVSVTPSLGHHHLPRLSSAPPRHRPVTRAAVHAYIVLYVGSQKNAARGLLR